MVLSSDRFEGRHERASTRGDGARSAGNVMLDRRLFEVCDVCPDVDTSLHSESHCGPEPEALAAAAAFIILLKVKSEPETKPTESRLVVVMALPTMSRMTLLREELDAGEGFRLEGYR